MSNSPTSKIANLHCLPVGTVIADFEIIGLVGEGGFGIVYLARDPALDRIVALKEFMPAAFAVRVDGIRVAVRVARDQPTYQAGLRSFINEARMLAKFSHPALVEVYRFWESNGTAYMAMQFYPGETLKQRLTKGETKFSERLIAQVMAPIFDALTMLHREQVFHRDIAPDNIIFSDDRSVLLDFGAARRIIGDGTQALTTILKPGYAPIEQYVDDGTMRQGPWTDVYALGGVLYYLATGKVPPQSVSRLVSDPLPTVNEVTSDAFSPAFSKAVAKAMAVRVDNRLQSVKELSDMLGWNTAQQVPVIGALSDPAVAGKPTGAQTHALVDGGSNASRVSADHSVEIHTSQARRSDDTLPFESSALDQPNAVPSAGHATTKKRKRGVLLALGGVCLASALVGVYLQIQKSMSHPASSTSSNAKDSKQSLQDSNPTPAKDTSYVKQVDQLLKQLNPTVPSPTAQQRESVKPVGDGMVRKLEPVVNAESTANTSQVPLATETQSTRPRPSSRQVKESPASVLTTHDRIVSKLYSTTQVNTVNQSRCVRILQKMAVDNQMTPEDKLFLTTSCQ